MASETKTAPTVALSNGVLMPELALGTAPLSATAGELPEHKKFVGLLPERVYRSFAVALDSGLRHVDTALCYNTHKQVGYVLADFFMKGRLTRSDVFITSKIFHPDNDGFSLDEDTLPANLSGMSPQEVADITTQQFERTLREIGVGYIDLMLLHWPGPRADSRGGVGTEEENAANRLAAWQVLEKMYEKGWARAIGVSNFSEIHLERLKRDGAKVIPMVNQIEASIFLQQDKIVKYCKENGILPEAYSPLGRGVNQVTSNPTIMSIGKKHGKDVGQVAMRYLLQKGYALTFWSGSEERVVSNQKLYDFNLDEEDMKTLDSLNVPDGSWGLPSPYDIK